MPGKVDIPDIPIATTVDPALVDALRQVIANQRVVTDKLSTDIVTFNSTATTVTVAHKLGKKPAHWRVLGATGTATIHATEANKRSWTRETVVFTTSATGTEFTVEVM